MIKDRLHEVELAIDEARARRTLVPQDESVRLIAVTKNHGIEEMREAIDAGAADIGENRIQELPGKRIPCSGM
jgi:uncharacterized pyridoxal phosphate-containing UPF0001 family protein